MARARSIAPSTLATLAPVDRDLLEVVATQRVITMGQLARLFQRVPLRTLRYRTARLVTAGLLGRTRPYRARGSAPSYFWPTRAADAYVGGASARGGPRTEPNPFFLAHAAAITKLYVGLATGGAPGLRLERFVREVDAREPFRIAGRPRAIAPDARIELRDDADRLLLAHVEVDRGTMSVPRLKVKAMAYAAYWVSRVWSGSYPFCPALLFLTTGEARADGVLAVFRAAAERARDNSYRAADAPLSVGACAMVDDQHRALADACWRNLAAGGGLRLDGCLSAARLLVDRELATVARLREARARRLAELHARPALLLAHLRGFERRRVRERLVGFGVTAGHALDILFDADAPISDLEAAALAAVNDYLGLDALDLGGDSTAKPTAEQRAPLDQLADHYRARQLALLDGLISSHGELRGVVLARDQLRRGTLLSLTEQRAIAERALRESELRRAQDDRRADYLRQRGHLARQLTGPVSRLIRPIERAEADLDLALLRRCLDCGEPAFPRLDPAFGRLTPAQLCARCGGAALQPPGDPARAADLLAATRRW